MKNIKNWIIKILGGYTKKQLEEQRLQHEKWAVKYLTGKNGEVTPDFSNYYPYDGDDIIVIRSKIRISNGIVTKVNIAPWCRDVITSGLRSA